MTIMCSTYPGRFDRIAEGLRIWARAATDDGRYASDVPVDFSDVTLSETLLHSAVRSAVAAHFQSELGGLILATDIRIV